MFSLRFTSGEVGGLRVELQKDGLSVDDVHILSWVSLLPIPMRWMMDHELFGELAEQLTEVMIRAYQDFRAGSLESTRNVPLARVR